ncbi:MAG: metal-responsive CopG/Arc/MetJ family transcriptional regulator [Yoonia sp.]|jgi:metal-responsive CopG/Arc/MetJ family transcriptional regulator
MAMKTGRPKKDTEQLSLRLERTVIERIDDLRKTEKDLPSRPEMIRRIIDQHLNLSD